MKKKGNRQKKSRLTTYEKITLTINILTLIVTTISVTAQIITLICQ